MTFLVIYADKYGNHVSECDARFEAIELIQNILESGSVAIDAITVYEGQKKEIILGIET
jgi:hypothetical protein